MGLAPIVLTGTTLRVAVTTARVLAEGGSTGRLIRDRRFCLNSLGCRKQVMVKGVGDGEVLLNVLRCQLTY